MGGEGARRGCCRRGASQTNLSLSPLELFDPLALRLCLREGGRCGLLPLLALLLSPRPLRLSLLVPPLRCRCAFSLTLPLLLRLRLSYQRLPALFLLLAPALLLRREQCGLLRRERRLLLALPRLEPFLLLLAQLLRPPLRVHLGLPSMLLSRALGLRLLATLIHPPRLLAGPLVAVRRRRTGLGRRVALLGLRLLHGACQPLQRRDVLHKALPAALAGLQ